MKMSLMSLLAPYLAKVAKFGNDTLLIFYYYFNHYTILHNIFIFYFYYLYWSYIFTRKLIKLSIFIYSRKDFFFVITIHTCIFTPILIKLSIF
jgi:hypothetical protein